MELAETINYLKHVSTVENVNIWVDLSERLTKSCNNRAEINLKKINMHGKEGEYIAVPGKVLGTGVISYPFKIAAYKFSPSNNFLAAIAAILPIIFSLPSIRIMFINPIFLHFYL